MGHWLGTGSEMCQPNGLGEEEAGSNSHFQDNSIIPRTFIKGWYCLNLQQSSKEYPIHFHQVSKLFQTKSD